MMARGKRTAKRTSGLGKRLMSAFLATVMCVSLVQVGAFAAEPTDADKTKQAQEQILGGTNPKYYTWNATLGENGAFEQDPSTGSTVKNGPHEDVVISKSIAPTGVENEFEITLNVQTNQTIEETVTYPNVAVTLVLDVSTSMSDGDMTAMQEALTDDGAFLDKLAANANGAKRMVSVVAFCRDTTLESGWVDITDPTNMETIKRAINTLDRDGGTCTQGGLLQAKSLLEQDVVSSDNFAYRYAVLMTDGIPNTLVTKANVTAGNYEGYYYNYDAYHPLNLWDKEDKYQGVNWWTHDDFKSEEKASYGDPSIYAAYRAEKVAEEISALPNTELYAIGYGNDLNVLIYDSAYTNPNKTSKTLINGETWLAQNVVEQSDHYFKADMSGLSTVFQSIVNEITVQAGAWMVTDPMGDHIILDVNSLSGVAGVHVNGSGLQWNLRQATKGDDGYTMTYKVKLDVAGIINANDENGDAAVKEAFEKHYLTNGETSLTYYIQDENGNYLDDEHQTLGASELEQALMTMHFKVPAVKGYQGKLSFTKVNEENACLMGARFKLKMDGNDNVWSREVTSDADGAVEFLNIPSGYSYTLSEVQAPAGYDAVQDSTVTVAYGEVTASGVTGGEIVDPLHQELVNVTITKTWQKPATEGTANNIEVTLLQDGESYETRIISAEDCEVSADGTVWTYTFTDLPKYKSAGKEYAYTVEETEMVGWTTTYTEDNRGIINTVNGTTIVSVTKNWILPEGMTSAPVVTVKLLRNGSETGDTRTLVYNASGDTVYFTNLPKYDENGQLYTYAVEEAQGAYQMANAIEYGTEGMINTVVITNTVADETTTVSGTKYWNDDMTRRPDSITVALYVDGQAAVDSEGNPMTAEATAATNWQYSFTDLPRYEFTRDADKNITAVREIEYTVEETEVEGYTSVVDGYNITNTRTGVVDLTVNKVWVDTEDAESSEIEIQLYANGQAYGDAVWMSDTYTFDDLPKYDEYGLEITWSVQETVIPMGYTPSYSDVEADGQGNLSVTITNTQNIIDDTLTVTVTKVWQQPSDIAPQTAYFSLYADGEEVANKKLALTGNNIGSFSGLRKYKTVTDAETGETDLVEIRYAVYEDIPSGYESNLSNKGNLIANSNGDMVYHFVNTIEDEISVSVQKQWVKPATVETPDVTFTVKRAIGSGEAETVGTIVLENGESSGKLSGLDEYNEYGQRYSYSIVEESLSGYSAAITGGVQADGNYVYDVVNTINQANVDLRVFKKWIDGGLDASERPSVKLWVLQNGMDGGLYNGQPDVRWVEFYYDATEGAVMAMTQDNNVVAATVSEDGNTWSYTFQLSKYSQDRTLEYIYSVAEYDVPAGYRSVVEEGTTVYNTRVGTIDIPVTKYWVDPAGTDRPEITLTLSGTDESTRTIVMDDVDGIVTATVNGVAIDVTAAGNAWTVTLEGLPQYDNAGAKIAYSLTENAVSGYDQEEVEGNPFAVLNRIRQEANVTATATKAWVMDTSGVNKSVYPDSITVALLRDGIMVEASKQTVEKGENDIYTILPYENLEKYDTADGHVYKYEVVELNKDDKVVANGGTVSFGRDNDYTVSYEDGIITNTYKVPAKYFWYVTTYYKHYDADGKLIADESFNSDTYAEEISQTVTVKPDDYKTHPENGKTYTYVEEAANVTEVELVRINHLYQLVLHYELRDVKQPGGGGGNGGGNGGGGNVPPVIIEEEEPPLAELPEEEPPLAELPEEEVPLAAVPMTGDTTALYALLAMGSAMGLMYLFLTGKKREEEI